MTPEDPCTSLTAQQARAVRDSIASAAIEGWQPTKDDTELLRRVAVGTITAANAVDHVLELHVSKRSHPDPETVSAQHDWDKTSWDDYLYPGTNVLINRLNIDDSQQLTQVDGVLVAIRTIEATTTCYSATDTLDETRLRALHQRLAQDLYDWAGHYRSVPIGKLWSHFAPVDEIAACVERAVGVIAETNWAAATDDEFAERAAVVYSWLNYAHPFRDLNGRSTRLFMNCVAAQAHRVIDYSRIPGEVWIQRSAFTVPDQGQATPQPEYMTPVFRAVSTRRET